MGKLEEARPLLEEALQGRRETLVDRHPSTLASIYNAGLILEAMGAAGAGGGNTRILQNYVY